MFKNQIDNHEFTENVVANKKYLLRNMALNFQNHEFNTLCKIAFYLCFCYKVSTLAVKQSMMQFWNTQQWLNKKICML